MIGNHSHNENPEDLCFFLVEAFQFSIFHGNEAKHDKHDFNRGLTVTCLVRYS